MSPEVTINTLKAEMQRLGYAEGEVNAFIHDFTGDKKLSELNSKEYEELADYLHSYIRFARKSRNIPMKAAVN